MIRTGIFSGSFNPVHIGHLALANWLAEFCGLDEVWFVVTPQNPLKQQSDLMADELRFQMVSASVGDYPRFKASDFEFYLPKPSYTIDTLQALRESYPDREFHFIMGADNWVSINRWKEYEKLLSEYPILVYPRLNYEIVIPEQYINVTKANAPIIEISSTFIRESLRSGKDVRFFIPEPARALLPTLF